MCIVLPARLLPRYFKALYQDTMRSCSCILDNPLEYASPNNTYILDCSSARVISLFDDAQVISLNSSLSKKIN